MFEKNLCEFICKPIVFLQKKQLKLPYHALRIPIIFLPVKETIIKCEFNAESALGTLLNSPIGGGRLEEAKKRPKKMKPKPTRSSPPPCENLDKLGATAASSPPVPIVLTAAKVEEKKDLNFPPKPQCAALVLFDKHLNNLRIFPHPHPISYFFDQI